MAAEKKRAILLSSCGVDTYQLIRNLVVPEKPTERTFDQLVELVQRHHNPRLSVIQVQFLSTKARAVGGNIRCGAAASDRAL